MKKIFIALLLCSNLAFALTPMSPPTKVTLVADSETVVPGNEVRVGVHFEIEPEWHIYYKEATGAGLPTKVELILPEGFTSSGISWPIPHEFKVTNELFGKGYEKEALMFASVTAPKDLPEGGPVALKAKVSWLNCSAKMCVPAKKELDLTLQIAKSPKPVQSELFATWEKKVS